MKDIKQIRLNFHSVFWVMHAPRVWDLGCWGQKFNFLNMVMWHILKGMSSRPGYTEHFYPRIKLVTLRWGQRIKYHQISSRAWGFAMARQRMCSSLIVSFLLLSITNIGSKTFFRSLWKVWVLCDCLNLSCLRIIASSRQS